MMSNLEGQIESNVQPPASTPTPTLVSSQVQPQTHTSTNVPVTTLTSPLITPLIPVTTTTSTPANTPLPTTALTPTSAPVSTTTSASVSTAPPIPAPTSPQKGIVTQVKLTDELNIFDWFRTTDLINQIAEKAKSSVDSVITALDPGMKEYLYSGGSINILVISDTEAIVSPIRDAFQSVFGRATVVRARYCQTEAGIDYPVKLASGFEGAVSVAKEKIRKLRLNTSKVPQNQVIVAVQPTIVSVVDNEKMAGDKSDNDVGRNASCLNPKFFLTYCMIIEDPVLGCTLNSYSNFIPMDSDIVEAAGQMNFPENFNDSHLGFAKSIDELMNAKLSLKKDESEESKNRWVELWSGLDELKVTHDLGISLAHLYKRAWGACVNGLFENGVAIRNLLSQIPMCIMAPWLFLLCSRASLNFAIAPL